MKKTLTALLLALTLTLTALGTNTYAQQKTNLQKIEELQKNNYIQGYEDNSLHLEKNITRAEITKLLTIASNHTEIAERLKNQQSNYTDVDKKHWANGYINAASRSPVNTNKIYMIKGYPDSTFKPEKNINLPEMAKMLCILCDPNLTSEEVEIQDQNWPKSWIEKAEKLGLMEGLQIPQNKTLNREEAFTMYYNGLNKTGTLKKQTEKRNSQNQPNQIKINKTEDRTEDLNNLTFIKAQNISNMSQMGKDILFGTEKKEPLKREIYSIKLTPQEEYVREVTDDQGNKKYEKIQVNIDRLQEELNKILLDAKRKGRIEQKHIDAINHYGKIAELSEENAYKIEEKLNEIQSQQKEKGNSIKAKNYTDKVENNFEINNFKELLVALSENMLRKNTDIRIKVNYAPSAFQKDLNLATSMNYSGRRPEEIDYYSINKDTIGILIHYPETEEETDRKVKEIVENNLYEGMTEYEKIKTLHDYLLEHSEYQLKDKKESYDASGVLLTGKGVCESYTNAFQKLCNAAGIPCVELIGTGQSENHTWNAVKIDGQYYLIDTTWDDRNDEIIYRFFLQNEKNFVSHENTIKMKIQEGKQTQDIDIPVEQIVKISDYNYDSGYQYTDQI